MKKTAPGILFNISPVFFSKEKILVGRVDYKDKDAYAELREKHYQTHAFRFDSRDKRIANITLPPDVQPLGEVKEEDIQGNLLLLGRAVQKSILLWLANKLPIVKSGKRLAFWGGRPEALLLSKAVEEVGLKPISGVEVVTRYDIDTRMFWSPDLNPKPYLGVLIDISTSNVIDLPVSELIRRGVPIVGKYVCIHEENRSEILRSRLDVVGMVSRVEGDRLLLTDTEGIHEIDAKEAFLEPRQENLELVVRVLYREKASGILERLRQLRGPLTTAAGKLARIRQTLKRLQEKSEILLGEEVKVTFGDLLASGHPLFPKSISTSRPLFLFGPQGRKSGRFPDQGIQTWGPFKYMQHPRNSPLVAVICEASYQGRVEQFITLLRDGFPDESWQEATKQRKNNKRNPFQSGLLGKFRLSRVDLEWETTKDSSAHEYRRASERLLERLSPNLPDLAIVQIRKEFKELRGDENPYLISKAAFMGAGVPVQAVCVENIEADDLSLPYILNNIALASYAKLDGIPWVISTRGPTSHELVIGLGYTEVGRRRLGSKVRYVGITTVFQGDGRYIVWGLTREVEFENYAEALLENLKTTIHYVRRENHWQPGDNVRLIFQVYKPLKNREIGAIKQLVRDLVGDYHVEYAFLDLSHDHMYQIFDPAQPGILYFTPEGRRRIKGKGIPERGLCYQLSGTMALICLTGPRDLKTAEQGVPRPLLVKLHPESDFRDLSYLMRQIFHFTYMSWQSFFPANEPVTILYSRLIARLLGNLGLVTGWSSKVLSVGSLRNRRWFL